MATLTSEYGTAVLAPLEGSDASFRRVSIFDVSWGLRAIIHRIQSAISIAVINILIGVGLRLCLLRQCWVLLRYGKFRSEKV